MKRKKGANDIFPAGDPLTPLEAAKRGRSYSVQAAADKLSCSTASIERRAIEWVTDPVQYKFRYFFLVWDLGGEPERRYVECDLEAVLFEPDHLPRASRARLRPRFIHTQFSTKQ